MSLLSRIPTGREPTFLRTNRFAAHGVSAMSNCGRGLKRCRGTTGPCGTLPFRKKISQRILRGIASRSCWAARTTCPTTSARRCSHSRVSERKASELESSRSAMTEKDSDQKARRQDRRHHRRDRRDWVGYRKAVRRRGSLCLHYWPPPEASRRGREGNRRERLWSSGSHYPAGWPRSCVR